MTAAPPATENRTAPSTRTSHEDGGYTLDRSGFAAHIGGDGSIRFDDHAFRAGIMLSPVTGLAFVANFDLTDVVMRWRGEDPYLFEKLSILESTREERWVARARDNETVMDRALADLPRYLAAVWAYRAWPAETRRQILFALWDEAAEDGNEMVRRGGAEARRQIERFIVATLPADSSVAFTREELGMLNASRQSSAVFTPYAEGPAHEPEHDLSAAPVIALAAIMRTL